MTSSSVSVRITRHTEDLAQTIHALSQRVVQLEERLALMEDHLATSLEEELPAEQMTSLANVDQLLRDCRELLAADPHRGATASDAGRPAAGRVASKTLPASERLPATEEEDLDEAA
ncbi:MAG: LysR family transcriptional regulator [Cyanobacteriota bacterium]